MLRELREEHRGVRFATVMFIGDHSGHCVCWRQSLFAGRALKTEYDIKKRHLEHSGL